MRSLSPFFSNAALSNWPFRSLLDDEFFKPMFDTDEFKPQCDITETDKEYLVSMDIPGIPEKDIKVEVRDRELRITGERKNEWKDVKDGRVHRYERSFGRFERVFELPEGADTSKVEAQHRGDGVLRIVIPKGLEVQARQIEVKRLN